MGTGSASAEIENGGIQLNLVPKEGGNSFSYYASGNYSDNNLQQGNIDDDIRARIEQGMLEWRAMIVTRLEQIMAHYPPRIDVSINALADMFSSTLEGGIILARVYGDNQALVDQVHGYRTHLRLLFEEI